MRAAAAASDGVRGEVGFIGPIEGLRGIAALWVVAFHYLMVRGGAFPQDPVVRAVHEAGPLQVIVGNGYLGVDLFFLITGFLLALPWLRCAAQARPAPPARAFYARRARRILPAYYVQLAFLFLVCLPLLRDFTFSAGERGYYAYNLVAHALMLHYTTPVSSGSMGLNGALWTLALEAQYYLLLPLLAPLFARAPWRAACAFFAIAVAWRWLAHHGLGPLVRLQMEIGAHWQIPEAVIRHFLSTQLPGYLAHFAAGILVGRAWLLRAGARPGRGASAAWMLLAAASVYALYRIHTPGGQPLGEHNAILIPAVLGLAMLALVASRAEFGEALLANRPLLLAGRASYSIYLYHLPLLLLFNRFTPLPPGSWLAFPAYLALVLAVAALSWRLVERPFLRRREASAARARAHEERGADGERLQEGHAPEHVGEAPRVHQHAEEQRRDREARVDA